MIPYGKLTIDLDAIAENWQYLANLAAPAECAASIKANAYGLGLEPVATTLCKAGCNSFFVAHLQEGLELRVVCPTSDIYILNGVTQAELSDAYQANLIPTANSLRDVEALKNYAKDFGTIAAALHIDSGLNRLGLEEAELSKLLDDITLLEGIDLRLILSHFSISENLQHPLNHRQHERFWKAVECLPTTKTSLANSSGIFLGSDYHFDMVRPGAALFGVNPTPGLPNPMRPVVKLEARILQIHDAFPGEIIGYGADYLVEHPARIAVISIGYGDGYPRSLSNKGAVFANGQTFPIVGRISMDLTTVDISAAEPGSLLEGSFVELIGPNRPLDVVAAEAGTIGYEILTALGKRLTHVYEPINNTNQALTKGTELCHT